MLLIGGIAVGAIGVIVAQERYLPPRLTPSASAELRNAFEQANAARARLTVELGDKVERLDAAVADRKRLADEITSNQSGVEGLRGDLATVIGTLPADPRGGDVQIRSGWFVAKGATLTYNLVLTREREREGGAQRPIDASMTFVLAGATLRGTTRNIALKPQAVTIANPQILRGSIELPADFRADQTTVQFAERSSGKALGMRVFIIR